MNTTERLKFFEQELDNRIKDFARKRVHDKNTAFRLKVAAVFLAATITVLLGLKVGEDLAKSFQNIALVFGAVITVLNAVEAFYDHRSLWIRRTVTLARLYALRTDLRFYATGLDESEIDVKTLGTLMDRYEHILQDDLRTWLKLREESPPPSEPPKTSS